MPAGRAVLSTSSGAADDSHIAPLLMMRAGSLAPPGLLGSPAVMLLRFASIIILQDASLKPKIPVSIKLPVDLLANLGMDSCFLFYSKGCNCY